MRFMSEIDEQELDAELRRLEEEERQVSQRRRRLHDRMALFPDPTGELQLKQQEEELSRERRDIHLRIDELRVRRNLLRDSTRG